MTQYGKFEYLLLSLGLCNAESTFQIIINTIVKDELDRHVLGFLDEALIHGHTREEHEVHIHAILDRFRFNRFFRRLKIVILFGEKSNILDII